MSVLKKVLSYQILSSNCLHTPRVQENADVEAYTKRFKLALARSLIKHTSAQWTRLPRDSLMNQPRSNLTHLNPVWDTAYSMGWWFNWGTVGLWLARSLTFCRVMSACFVAFICISSWGVRSNHKALQIALDLLISPSVTIILTHFPFLVWFTNGFGNLWDRRFSAFN